MLPGGGIGPELMHHVREIFGKIGVPVDFEIIDINPTSEGNDDLDYAITSIKRNGVAIKGTVLFKIPHHSNWGEILKAAYFVLLQFDTGNIETKSEATDTISRNVALRNELDLYVNVLECRSYPNIPARHKDVNIAIVRQNTEGEYAMLEHEVNDEMKSRKTTWFFLKRFAVFQSVPGVVESMKVVTEENSERVARYAFEYGA